MTVYYTANEEKPKNTENVRFFTDNSMARSYALEVRESVYSFEVNEKCDTDSFGMDTQMVFTKDAENGQLKFLASGRWVEIHELLNIPFYYDFEVRSNNFVSMSLRYFQKHYSIVEQKVNKVVAESFATNNQESTTDVINELFGV